MKRQVCTVLAGAAPIALLAAVLWLLSPVATAQAFHTLRDPATVTAHGEHTATLNAAAIVVQLDDRRIIVRWVDFTGTISGLLLLESAGLDLTVAETSFGPAVCAIEGIGCPPDNCFCNADQFWGYNFWDGTAWQSYPVGASTSAISATGAVEGWRWGAFGTPQAPAEQAIAAASALQWLRSQQNPATGGFGDSMGGAVEVLMALGTNHEDAATWKPDDGRRALDNYLLLRATHFSRNNVAAAGKLATAAAAADACRTHRSVTPSFYYSATLGAYSPDSGFNAWGILGAAAVGEAIPPAAAAALLDQQQEEGGWEWQAGFGADTNTTALAIQALIAAGQPVSSTAIADALTYLKNAQIAGGGIVYDPKTPESGADANSTAYAIQAILAAGGDPAGEAWTVDGRTPLHFLLGLQLADGSFEWQANTGSNLLATAQAVPALLGHAYPAAVRELEPCAARRIRLHRQAAACASPAAGTTGGACAMPAGAISETQP